MGAAQLVALVVSGGLMVQAWFPQMFDYWNNSASWSLSAEAFFYLLFPFLALLFVDRRRITLIVSAALLYVASTLPGFVYAAFEPRPAMGLQIFYAMPIFRLPEFAVGICTFYLIKDQRVLNWLPPLTGAALVVLTCYMALLGDRTSVFVLHNWIVVPTVALSIATLATCRTWAGAVLSHPLLVWGGKISYCFYSFQALVIFSLRSVRN